MLHRRLRYDDSLGVSEALNEPGKDGNGLVVRGTHRIIIDGIEESVPQMKTMSKSITWKPLPTFDILPEITDFASRPINSWHFSGMNQPLPENIHLLSLEP